MRRRAKKLTPSLLRKIVMEETRKTQRRQPTKRRRVRRMREQVGSGTLEPVEDVKAVEVDADAQGTSVALEKDIDHAQVLKLEEARLTRKLRKVREARKRVRARITKRL